MKQRVHMVLFKHAFQRVFNSKVTAKFTTHYTTYRQLLWACPILLLSLSVSGFANDGAEKNAIQESNSKEYLIEEIIVANVNSTINPSTSHYLEKILNNTSKEGKILLIKLNTPGGLVTTTKDILNLFGKSEIPIVIWITPEGASATSAGALIAAGAHAIFMSAGTNMGAATPVMISGDLPKNPQNPLQELTDKESSEENNNVNDKQKTDAEEQPSQHASGDMRAKAINDLVALVKSLSEARNRPTEPFELMVTEAKSYTVNQAIEAGIINGQANRLAQLVQALEGTSIQLMGEELMLTVAPAVTYDYQEMSLSDQIINLFAHPQTAYLLFLLGAALLYFEMQAPGGMIAGSIGVLCLVLAALGFQVLPINFAGVALIILALLFFIFDLYITSYGIFSLIGVGALFFGSSLLYQTDDSLVQLSSRFILSVVLAVGTGIGFVAWYFVKTLKRPKTFEKKKGQARIVKLLEQTPHKYVYHVRFEGSLWTAQSKQAIDIGSEVEVATTHDSMNLKINKVINP